MVKFDELNEDNIKDLSLEDLQLLALWWKDQLIRSRWVIWDLNKNLKSNKPESNETQGLTQEDLDRHYDQRQKQEKFNNFLKENNFDEEKMNLAKDYFEKWLSNEDIAKLTWVSSFSSNQNNSNRITVWAWDAWTWSVFDWQISYRDYSKLDNASKDAYKSYSRWKFWGLSFSRSQWEDL